MAYQAALHDRTADLLEAEISDFPWPPIHDWHRRAGLRVHSGGGGFQPGVPVPPKPRWKTRLNPF